MKKDYLAFAEHFVVDFAPEIFKTYLHQVELLVSGQQWLSKKSQYHIFSFFTEWYVFKMAALSYHSRLSFNSSIVSNRKRRGLS